MKVVLLDYDLTLYPPAVRALEELDVRINRYIEIHLGLAPGEAEDLRIRLSRRYGTTVRGLELLHRVDPDHYYDFIHQVEAIHFPPPDAELERWLRRLAHPLYLFTNSRRDWAEAGLRSMGLAGDAGGVAWPFREIFDIRFLGGEGKPWPSAYAKVEERLERLHGPGLEIVFADDKAENLVPARARGWKTVWIRLPPRAPAGPASDAREAPDPTAFDRVLSRICDLDCNSL